MRVQSFVHEYSSINRVCRQMLTSFMKLSFHSSKTANVINAQSLLEEYLKCLVQEQDEMIQVLRKKRVHQPPAASTSHQNVLHVHERLQVRKLIGMNNL